VTPWLIATCLLACAVAAAWPTASVRRRLAGHPPAPTPIRIGIDPARLRAAASSLAAHNPRRLTGLVAAAAAAVGWLAGGPVASLVFAVYGTLLTGAVMRRVRRREATVARAASLDDLAALGADLRAGLPPAGAADRLGVAAATAPVGPAFSARSAEPGAAGSTARRGPRHAICAERRIADLTAAVWRLAEQTGAPAADLVERIEADARGADRAKAAAAAQAAGAQATALLLAALPLAGIGLGYMIGADPLRVLLHTPLGAACAAGAVVLQCAGMLWADRLANGPAR
jgi:tight adherence protein B